MEQELTLISPSQSYYREWYSDDGTDPQPLPTKTVTFEWVPAASSALSTYAVAIGTTPGGLSGFTPGAGWHTTQQPRLTVELPDNAQPFYIRIFAYDSSGNDVAFNTIYRFISNNGTEGEPLPTPEPEPTPEPDPTPEPEPEPTPEPEPEPTPEPDPVPPPVYTGSLTGIWANNGQDKVTQDELRFSNSPSSVANSIWNGQKVSIFGGKNEVVAFNLVLEAAQETAGNVDVQFDQLVGPGGFVIGSKNYSGDKEELFDYTQRDIELFFVRYLEIKGVSTLGYGQYDQRHAPERLRRPHDARGWGTGYRWTDRPDHNKFYPDIAVPLELERPFVVSAGQNQSIWSDIYIPKNAPAGKYTGNVLVTQGQDSFTVPVELDVKNFTLPDEPGAKTMLFISTEAGGGQIPKRYGYRNLDLVNRHFMMAHRHKIELIDEGHGNGQPESEWIPRLNGSLFTVANGYRGPGEGEGNKVFSIGTYGGVNWLWNDDGNFGGSIFDWLSRSELQRNADKWQGWFNQNAPDVERFAYLMDEPGGNYGSLERMAKDIAESPGPGKTLMSLVTAGAQTGKTQMPSLDISPTWFAVAPTNWGNNYASYYKNDPSKLLYFYNGKRPATGTFMTEDDGVGPRVVAWAQYKHDVDRWFLWEGTYYQNYDGSSQAQGTSPHTNVFERAHTFGRQTIYDNSTAGEGGRGETGASQYTPIGNGDGVMFYPGTDVRHPQESYGLNGPIASLRLKHWRSGIQDVDYLRMAEQIDPQRVQQIVQQIVPKVLWEVGVEEPGASWHHTPVSWSSDPDIWEAARAELAQIIEDANGGPPTTVDNDNDGYDETVDCNDNDASINPGAQEIKEDGKDNDCNPATSDEVINPASGTDISSGLPANYEPSGVVWHEGLQKLFVVSDNGTLSQMNSDGTGVQNWTLGGDLEGVTYKRGLSDNLYIAVERPFAIMEFNPSSELVSKTVSLVGVIPAVSNANSGLESITFVPNGLHGYPQSANDGLFYIGVQETGHIHIVDIDFEAGQAILVGTLVPVAGRSDLSGLDFSVHTQGLASVFDSANKLRLMDASTVLDTEVAAPGQNQEGVALIPECANNRASVVIAEDSGRVMRYDDFTITCLPVDLDSDGYVEATDCNDFDDQVNPGMTEISGNGIDDDCNPVTSDDPAPEPEDISAEALVTHLRFDGSVTDSSGTDNHASLSGNAAFNTNGKHGGSLVLDGNASFAKISNTNDINLGTHTQRSISFWFNASNVQSRQVLYEEGAQVRGLAIYLDAGNLYVAGWNTPSNESNWTGTYLSTDQVQPGTWHHVALTLSGTDQLSSNSLTGYLDGQEFGSGAGSQLWAHSGGIGIGSVNGGALLHDGENPSDGAVAFAGQIDDFRIYNRALVPIEIQQLQLVSVEPLPLPYEVENDPVARSQMVLHYPIVPQGSVVTDYSLSGNSGQLRSGANGNAFGLFDQGVNFDGLDDFIHVNDSSQINLGTHTKRSVSLQFFPTQMQGKQVLYEEGGTVRGLNIYLDGAKLYVGGWNEPSNESGWDGTFMDVGFAQANTWNHVVLTLSGGDQVAYGALKGYLNGQLIGVGEGSQLWQHGGDIGVGATNNDTKFHDGDRGISQGDHFRGNIDDIRIYNRELSASEVSALLAY